MLRRTPRSPRSLRGSEFRFARSPVGADGFFDPVRCCQAAVHYLGARFPRSIPRRQLHLRQLEAESIYILREAFNKFERLAMLWSIGKDSTVLLALARKAFFGHVPFPLVHVDTTYKIPSMIEYRDRLVREWKLELIVGQNEEVLRQGRTFPGGKATRSSLSTCVRSPFSTRTVPSGSSVRAFRVSSEAPMLPARKATGRRPVQRSSRAAPSSMRDLC